MPFCVSSAANPPEFYLTCDGGSYEGESPYNEWVPCPNETPRTTDPNESVRSALADGWVIVEDTAYCAEHKGSE